MATPTLAAESSQDGRVTRNARLARLSTAITDLEQSYEHHSRRSDNAVLPFILAAEGILVVAQRSLRDEDPNTGWTLIHRAERTIVPADAPEQFQARAVRLREEARTKLTGWRREAALKALGDPGTSSIAGVQTAMDVLSEHAGNMYHKAALLAEQITVIGWIGAIVIAGVLGAAYAGVAPLGPLRHGLAWAALLGGLGGVLSAARGLTLGMKKKIPEQVYSWPITVARPLVAAAAGLGVFVVLTAGIVSVAANTELARLAAAFVAGFSERYFLSLLPSSDEKSSG